MSNVRHFKGVQAAQAESLHDHPEEVPSFNRAQFDSSYVIVRYCAEISNITEGEHIIRRLLQTVAYLERRHGLKGKK